MLFFFYLFIALSISAMTQAQVTSKYIDIKAADKLACPGDIDIKAGEDALCPGSVNIIGGHGLSTGGGNVNIFSGEGSDISGNINISTPNGFNFAGNINITGGNGPDVASKISIKAGNSNGFGGAIDITAGNGWDGGYINLKPGDGSIGSDGLVKIWGSGCYTGSWTLCSDERFKKNINDLEGSLNSVLQLRGVNFEFKTDEFPEKKFNEGKQIGLIAQEVEKVYPEFVMTDYEGYKSVAYQNLVTVLIEAVKEQQKQIETLKNRIEYLATKLEANIIEVSTINK